MIKNYPAIKNEHTTQACIFVNAIENAVAETRALPDGDLRVRAIEMLYFKGTHTIEGAATKVGVSERTLQYWMSRFVKLVGRNAGFV